MDWSLHRSHICLLLILCLLCARCPRYRDKVYLSLALAAKEQVCK